MFQTGTKFTKNILTNKEQMPILEVYDNFCNQVLSHHWSEMIAWCTIEPDKITFGQSLYFTGSFVRPNFDQQRQQICFTWAYPNFPPMLIHIITYTTNILLNAVKAKQM